MGAIKDGADGFTARTALSTQRLLIFSHFAL
jgi:hypothetical protein